MPAADPIPVSAHPHVAGCRRYPDDFHARRRRRDHDDAPDIMPLVRDDHASGESRAEHEGECRSCDWRLALIHDLFRFNKELKDLNVLRSPSLTGF
jgi:hypothetical protein